MRRKKQRMAQVHGAWLAFLASVLVLAVLIGLLAWGAKKPDTSTTTQPLMVYCAAGIKTPVEAIAQEYERQYSVPVQLQYGGSQTLLTKIELKGEGDLYLPGDDSYLHMARKKDLLAETLPLARMMPVLAVRKGNPKHLHTLQDILKGDTRLSQANPDAAAVGKLARDALQKRGQWEAWQKHVIVSKTTVNDVANDIALGAADAGIVWDSVVRQMPALEMVALPELSSATAHVAVGVLKGSPQPMAALRFARYLAAHDRGANHFRKAGFTPVEGDRWTETPELRLFAGAMLRPAIEETIAAFREREGAEVTCVYNGCGILVAQMTTNHQSPDAYFACDQSFMTQVKDLFLDPATISSNQLVIFVHKGNPHHIESLDDLGKPGLKIGVGHEKQCAMGALTQETLKQGRAHHRVMKNVKVQSPTGDMLINQLLTGSLDAIIAYISNGANAADKLEAIPLAIPCAIAVQPIAIGKDSEYKQLTQRLVDAIRSRESRERFESYGFHWRAPR
ncbi:MAG TPA: molybdate ABC transporter substrate-binding protein [Gemmataceae bacterium]|nr:molybdate ABC transporter substrate-binding protein [Gemmataceae bacterium]